MPKSRFKFTYPAQMQALRTEINGNSLVFIEGCRAIAEYGEEEVKIRSDKLFISIKGKKLELIKMDSGCATVKGKIKMLQYEEVNG